MANIFWVGATLPKTEKNRGWKIPDCEVQMIRQIIITFDTTPCQIWSQIVHGRTPSFNSLVMELQEIQEKYHSLREVMLSITSER